ncbi:uncharacterized protein SPSC_03442 [Sporisorium scitamineum]|uniref:Uncharacterized protein n=1 Tax=Sporisorium scitamineum TaxID=49012 RepID=A0A140KMV1_9BASI|nr:uncharacterized protein SPSC_03442 [Sporisorium scitamineum]
MSWPAPRRDKANAMAAVSAKRKRRRSSMSTAHDRFWSLVPGRTNLFTELARMQARLERSPTSQSGTEMRTFSRLIDFLSLSRIAKPRCVQECEFCSSLAVQPPFCFAPLPAWIRPVASRQHKNSQSTSVAQKCLVQRALNCSNSTHPKLLVMFASKPSPSTSTGSWIRLVNDTDARGQPMLMLPSYRVDLCNFAHAHGVQRLVDTLEQTCLAANVPDAIHPCAVPHGLDLLRNDLALLVESVERCNPHQDIDCDGHDYDHDQDEDDQDELYQQQRREQRQQRWLDRLVELHQRFLCADFADWIMYQASQQFHALADDEHGASSTCPSALPRADWLVDAANKLHSDYPPEAYHHQGSTFTANRHLNLDQLQDWWRAYLHASNTTSAASKRPRRHTLDDELQQQQQQQQQQEQEQEQAHLPPSSVDTNTDKDSASAAAMDLDPASDDDDDDSAGATVSVGHDSASMLGGDRKSDGHEAEPAAASSATMRTRIKEVASALVLNVCMAGVAFGLGRLSASAGTTTATATPTPNPSLTLSVDELLQLALKHLT